uniref:Uracil-DNA glycosylase-like domain-containing protein n=1 Tax=Plectus sambesii TaxID=2011161 RepID=A0A914UXB3_9BILA
MICDFVSRKIWTSIFRLRLLLGTAQKSSIILYSSSGSYSTTLPAAEMLKRKATEDAKENNDTPKKQKSMTDFFATKEVKTSVTAVANDAKAAKSEGASGEKRLSALFTDAAWKRKMTAEMNKPYFAKIEKFLEEEYKKGKKIFPPYPEIFNAFNMAPLQQLKVVIIGQDPYHDNNQAHGLCFSVRRGINPPPSLKNMYKELSTDIEGFQIPTHGCLEAWAKQGILLLNASLTVELVSLDRFHSAYFCLSRT